MSWWIVGSIYQKWKKSKVENISPTDRNGKTGQHFPDGRSKLHFAVTSCKGISCGLTFSIVIT